MSLRHELKNVVTTANVIHSGKSEMLYTHPAYHIYTVAAPPTAALYQSPELGADLLWPLYR